MADENVGLVGAIYAHANAVTNAAANEIAEFRGGWTIALEPTFAEWFGQSTVRKAAEMTKLDVVLTVSEVAFKPATLSKLWDITPGAVAIKSVAEEAATSYTFGSTVTPLELQYLIECKLDGQLFQAYAPTGKINTSTINFTNEDFVVHDVPIILYGATGSLLTLIDED